MKRLVADTGPLLHLHEAAALHLLPLIGTVIVPARILAELRKSRARLVGARTACVAVRGRFVCNSTAAVVGMAAIRIAPQW